jgi:hypothetical protein
VGRAAFFGRVPRRIDLELEGGIMSDQAFPTYVAGRYDKGMTLRDYFAAKALVAVLANAQTYSDTLSKLRMNEPLDEFLARMAYRYADCMLKERESA